ncbi:MAG TPA: hypothetical protein VNS79_15480 [Sphingobium sp.]|nr:hypothetical protein [Sphingobium sp.]
MRSLYLALLVGAIGLGGPAMAQDFDLMQFADADQDGKVSEAEYASFREQGWTFISQGAETVKVADLDDMMKGAIVGVTPDAQGQISKAAYLAATPALFKAADKNGDGSLDAQELNASMMPAG